MPEERWFFEYTFKGNHSNRIIKIEINPSNIDSAIIMGREKWEEQKNEAKIGHYSVSCPKIVHTIDLETKEQNKPCL